MKRILTSLFFVSLLSSCRVPGPNEAFVSQDQRHWVSIDSIPADESKEQLLPTVGLTLRSRYSTLSRRLLEGVESLCGTSVVWDDFENLFIRISVERAGALKVRDGERVAGVTLHVLLHEDQVKEQKASPDGKYRLVVIAKCETENWNLYLRRAGEPNYNAAMDQGWDDPDIFGGFGYTQPHLALRWTGARTAEIEIPDKRYGVTLREQIGEVHLKWIFIKHYKLPGAEEHVLAPIKN